MKAGILTVSDSCARGEREDLSGEALAKAVEKAGWTVAARSIVADDAQSLKWLLIEWCGRRRLDLLLTTGGTGLGPRDVTPEATRAVLEREVPGLSELIRREGLRKTPMAALSRGLAGSRGKTLIVNLPGSPAGAVESFEAVRPALAHAAAVLSGGGHAHPAHGRRGRGKSRRETP